MKIFLLILSILFPLLSWAQNEDFNWIFNLSSTRDCENIVDVSPLIPIEAFCPTVLTFQTNPPSFFQDEKIYLDFLLTNATFSSPEGELLFYSNGMSIHTKEHLPLVGADTLSHGPAWESRLWTNEYGESETTGYDMTYGAVFVPKPGHPDSYYHLYTNYDKIFNDRAYGYVEKQFAEIELLDDGSSQLVFKDRPFADRISTHSMLTCSQHANGRDWWLLQNRDDKMLSYLVTENGIAQENEMPLNVEIDSIATGTTKFNKTGDKFGIFQLAEPLDSFGNELIIGDFDRCNGIFFNEEKYNLPSFNSFFSNGLEFSPSGKYLYINDLESVYQLDLEADDMISSMIEVMEWDSTYSIFPGLDTLVSDVPNTFGFMQRGPDDKIYIAGSGQGHFLHIIHNPDKPGLECNPENRAIRLPTYHYGTIPNFPTLRLGPIDGSPCDTLDIDNRPVSKFRYELDRMDTLMIDFVDLSYFEPKSWEWDFGDGNKTVERFPTHVYSQPGVYEVCLTVANGFSSDTSCDTLFLGTTSLKKLDIDRNITLFPNPASDQIRVSFHDYLPLEPQLRLYDMKGRQVLEHKLSGVASSVDIWSLMSGVYTYEVWDDDLLLKRDRIIKI